MDTPMDLVETVANASLDILTEFWISDLPFHLLEAAIFNPGLVTGSLTVKMR